VNTDRNVKIKTGPLFEMGREQINRNTSAEENPEVAKKNILISELKEKTQRKVIDEQEDAVTINRFSNEEKIRFKKLIAETLSDILKEEGKFIGRLDKDRIIEDVTDEITGYGPIDPFLHDTDVNEVMVNGPKNVYVERNGKITRTGVVFRDDDHVRHVIDKIISPLGRRLDESSPMVDARLPDGSRVNAIIPPLAIDGPSLTVRKFKADPLTVEDLIRFGTMTTDIATFLKACVEARLNIIISGGTGSGKTSTLNVISSFIPREERIVTVEDAAELQLWQEHIVRLETRPANIEGKGKVATRDLVINCLRMRPDRIIVGEVRGAEALDMLQAMNTGHDGSLTTAHSNSPRDTLFRIETMVLMAGFDLPLRAIREQISNAIQLIVHQERFKDGTRKITNVTEITGMEGDKISLQDLFLYEKRGIDDQGRIIGRHVPTGVVPKFIDKIESAGIFLPHQIFRRT
jgi:pilus assembly protein CpaF